MNGFWWCIASGAYKGRYEERSLVKQWFSVCLSNTYKVLIILVKGLKGLTFVRIWSKLVEIESGYEVLLYIGWSCNCFVACWWAVDKIKVFCERKALDGAVCQHLYQLCNTYSHFFIHLLITFTLCFTGVYAWTKKVSWPRLSHLYVRMLNFPRKNVSERIFCWECSIIFEGWCA